MIMSWLDGRSQKLASAEARAAPISAMAPARSEAELAQRERWRIAGEQERIRLNGGKHP
jgi:hypothetical protein